MDQGCLLMDCFCLQEYQEKRAAVKLQVNFALKMGDLH